MGHDDLAGADAAGADAADAAPAPLAAEGAAAECAAPERVACDGITVEPSTAESDSAGRAAERASAERASVRGASAGPGPDDGGGSMWPELDRLVGDLLGVRREVAAAQAREAGLLADAVELVMARMEQRRLQGEHRSDPDLPLREVALEVGMALRVSDRTVQARMGDAHQLVSRFTATYDAWREGRIDAGHAWAIARTGLGIASDDDRARFENLALEVAATESPGRMTAAAKAIAATVAPHDFADRARRAVDDRSVRVYDLDDGLARLIADLPAALAYGIRDRLTQLAKTALTAEADSTDAAGAGDADADALLGAGAGTDANASAGAGGNAGAGTGAKAADPTNGAAPVGAVPEGMPGSGDTAPGDTGPDNDGPGDVGSRNAQPVNTGAPRRGEPVDPVVTTGPSLTRDGGASKDRRTLEQARADVLADLLLAGTPATLGDAGAAITASVHITVPALTLAGAGTAPALLEGYGPIDPDTARRLTGLAPAWNRVFTDPATGVPVAVDRYRPSAELRRFLIARDERCRTPGCTRTAVRCDIDHNHDAANGGQTTACNLCHFCRRHHVAKHNTAWRVRQLPGGIIEWTGPTGRTYRDRPPTAVRFIPEDSPPF